MPFLFQPNIDAKLDSTISECRQSADGAQKLSELTKAYEMLAVRHTQQKNADIPSSAVANQGTSTAQPAEQLPSASDILSAPTSTPLVSLLAITTDQAQELRAFIRANNGYVSDLDNEKLCLVVTNYEFIDGIAKLGSVIKLGAAEPKELTQEEVLAQEAAPMNGIPHSEAESAESPKDAAEASSSGIAPEAIPQIDDVRLIKDVPNAIAIYGIHFSRECDVQIGDKLYRPEFKNNNCLLVRDVPTNRQQFLFVHAHNPLSVSVINRNDSGAIQSAGFFLPSDHTQAIAFNEL
ncbi:hypothetical protein IJT17_08250 [bacterium]|nr:hypothetical protein [bacterium]